MTTLATDNKATDFELRELWRRYGEEDDAARERLVLHYAPLVKQIAGRLKSRLPPHVEVGDLISSGLMGLLGAMERYDSEQGVRFGSYAQTRIRGAMLDSLRSLDWVPRKVREKARRFEGVESNLRTKLGRSPSETELAAGLELGEEELQRGLLEIASSRIYSFDAPMSANGSSDESVLHDYVSGDGFADPQDDLDGSEKTSELRSVLTMAIAGLPERQQVVIGCYYRDELKLGEIGEVLGVSESRVSQLHALALISLRAAIRR